MKGADKFWARVPHNKIRKNVHINLYPETFNLTVIVERIMHMCDGALEHFSCAVRDVLSNTCHAPRMGRGGPTACLHAPRQIRNLWIFTCGNT
jgi:hypothetical protein